MWLDDAYFKGKQMHLEADAPRVALAYRVSTKGQVDHDDIPMQKIDCRKTADGIAFNQGKKVFGWIDRKYEPSQQAGFLVNRDDQIQNQTQQGDDWNRRA